MNLALWLNMDAIGRIPIVLLVYFLPFVAHIIATVFFGLACITDSLMVMLHVVVRKPRL